MNNKELDKKYEQETKDEFKKHLINNNYKNKDYREKNNILTTGHPCTYFKTHDGYIINKDSTAGKYYKDIYCFIDHLENEKKNKYN